MFDAECYAVTSRISTTRIRRCHTDDLFCIHAAHHAALLDAAAERAMQSASMRSSYALPLRRAAYAARQRRVASFARHLQLMSSILQAR